MKLVYGDYIRIAGGFFWWWKWENFRQLDGILPPSLEFPTKVLGKGREVVTVHVWLWQDRNIQEESIFGQKGDTGV